MYVIVEYCCYYQFKNYNIIFIPDRKDNILGAGEFGEVYRGVWDSPYGPQDVAIKLLRTNPDSSEKTKFLQEAAIMGQFRHPNIVLFIGAVTLSEPVSRLRHPLDFSWNVNIHT